jgi:hypothetical protein
VRGRRCGRERQGGGEGKIKKRNKKKVGPTIGGEDGGPPEMEGGRGNLEGYAKWRLV